MAKQWTCNEHECSAVITADDIDELIEQVNQHMAEAHDSYEFEEIIEVAAVDVDTA